MHFHAYMHVCLCIKYKSFQYIQMWFQGLFVIDLQMADYMRVLENAIQRGLPVLLQNVHERLDPSLDPILNKSVIKIGE